MRVGKFAARVIVISGLYGTNIMAVKKAKLKSEAYNEGHGPQNFPKALLLSIFLYYPLKPYHFFPFSFWKLCVPPQVAFVYLRVIYPLPVVFLLRLWKQMRDSLNLSRYRDNKLITSHLCFITLAVKRR